MLSAVSSSWTLLLGIGFIMLGNGLQGTLLGVRAAADGFQTGATGAVMAAYYVGILAGTTAVPRLVRRVGQIRVFAAFASLASAAVLLHYVFVDPWSWGAFRFATGFAYAGLYMVAESWLNARADNDTRGQLLAVYMLISLGGLGAGQLLLNVADPAGARLFILVSVLISVALIPISLSAVAAPSFASPRPMGVRALLRASPLGVAGCLAVGMTYGAMFGMGAVYASQIGLSLREVSYFMGALLLGGVVLQWPLGRLSDVLNRRVVIVAVTVAAAAAALAAIALAERSRPGLLALMALYGGLSLPLYSLCVAYTNDYLEPEEMVAGSGTIVLLRGVGAILGPAIAAALMSTLGPPGFLWFLVGVHAALALFACYRMTRRRGMAVGEQHHHAVMEPGAQSLAIATSMRAVRDAEERERRYSAPPQP